MIIRDDFLPRIVRDRLLRPGPLLSRPRTDEYQAVVLFLDIAGFTVLADQLAERPSGAEELSHLLNEFFDGMINIIWRRGGDVFSLAGDALLAIWPVGGNEADLEALVSHAAACGLEIQSHLVGRSFLNSVQLSVRVSVAFGQIVVMHVGESSAMWHLVITGEACDRINRADALTRPGDVIVSPEAWAIIARNAAGTVLSQGNVLINKIFERALPESPPSPLDASLSGSEAGRVLLEYVPAILRERLTPDETAWIREVRPISVLFVNLPDLDHRAPDALERAQSAVTTVREVLHHYEGDLWSDASLRRRRSARNLRRSRKGSVESC